MMKKRVISLLLAVMLLAGMMSVSAFADGDVEIELMSLEDSGEFYPGSYVRVPVKIGPEGYAGVQIDVKTTNITFNGYLWEEGYIEYSETGFLWLNGVADEDGGIDVTNGLVNVKNADLKDGIIGYLEFTVSDDVVAGDEFKIELTVSAASAEETWIVKEATLSTGDTISERPYIKGDINGDGKVNNKDVTRLIQFIKNKSNDVVAEATDVSGDGKTNNKDVTALIQYIKSL